eukprot:g75621.t1
MLEQFDIESYFKCFWAWKYLKEEKLSWSEMLGRVLDKKEECRFKNVKASQSFAPLCHSACGYARNLEVYCALYGVTVVKEMLSNFDDVCSSL